MNVRRLHILGTIHERLQNAQTDAIELACLDTCFSSVETHNADATLESMRDNPEDMLLVDVRTLANLIEQKQFVPDERVIVMLFERDNPEFAKHLEHLKKLRYLVGAGTPILMRGVLGTILEHRAAKKVRGIVPRMVQLERLSKMHRRLASSDERAECQEHLIQFFTDQLALHQAEMVSGISSFPKNLGDVLDELLMNAIWDANPNRIHAERSLVAKLEENEIVAIDAASDGQTLSITVTDRHGTFPKEAMFKPMKFALGFKDDTTINEGPGGAGLGIYMILQKVTAMSFEVERGRVTRVTALLRGDQSLRETQRRPRTILYLEQS